jgi:hypothetical protein
MGGGRYRSCSVIAQLAKKEILTVGIVVPFLF